MTFNLDTIWVTVVAGAHRGRCSGFWARAQLTKDTEDHVPTKIQLVWETIVSEVNTQVEDNLGKVNPFVVPAGRRAVLLHPDRQLARGHPDRAQRRTSTCCPSPTADTNLTYAMALIVIVGVWAFGIRQKGCKGYFKHFLEPYPVPAPAERPRGAGQADHAGPATLRQHLRRRHHARADRGLVSCPAHPDRRLLAACSTSSGSCSTCSIGGIQAFIFALLTVLYFGMAGAGHDEHDDEHERRAAATTTSRTRTRQNPNPRTDPHTVSTHQR